jgi:hypothetical protein
LNRAVSYERSISFTAAACAEEQELLNAFFRLINCLIMCHALSGFISKNKKWI